MQAHTYRWTCRCCGQVKTGLPMDLGYHSPAGWDDLTDAERARSHLDEDFCLMRHADGAVDRFIRAVLPIPVPEIEDEFRFGVWVSVSEKSWKSYGKATLESGCELDICFGCLCHDLPDMPESFGLHANVEFQDNGMRPRIFLHEQDHALVEAQMHGVNVAQVEKWASMAAAH